MRLRGRSSCWLYCPVQKLRSRECDSIITEKAKTALQETILHLQPSKISRSASSIVSSPASNLAHSFLTLFLIVLATRSFTSFWKMKSTAKTKNAMLARLPLPSMLSLMRARRPRARFQAYSVSLALSWDSSSSPRRKIRLTSGMNVALE